MLIIEVEDRFAVRLILSFLLLSLRPPGGELQGRIVSHSFFRNHSNYVEFNEYGFPMYHTHQLVEINFRLL